MGRQPLRAAFTSQPDPVTRFGPHRSAELLVVGGSLGAQALNRRAAGAGAHRAGNVRGHHQSGAKQIDQLRANYAAAGVDGELTPFIDDTARAYADADLVVARAGASTVTEIAAVGAAALFVPFPSAVDDHQTTNARFLVDAGGGWLVQQTELTPQLLADLLEKTGRPALVERASKAKTMQKTEAVDVVVRACEELANGGRS
jgi:UDP-N-acetylglucosamine--N-acetylmuramyl-(pentapeptide) pyrophosphoryl-undecaprenol N-acetylglucosamine transferase